MTQSNTVWVLLISHDHGTDYSVHASHNSATAELAVYCREWWSDISDAEPPEDNNEVIDTYFNNLENESYEIGAREIV